MPTVTPAAPRYSARARSGRFSTSLHSTSLHPASPPIFSSSPVSSRTGLIAPSGKSTLPANARAWALRPARTHEGGLI
jgi:hypothetical protein